MSSELEDKVETLLREVRELRRLVDEAVEGFNENIEEVMEKLENLNLPGSGFSNEEL